MKILLFSYLPNYRKLLITILFLIITESFAGSISLAMLIPILQSIMSSGVATSNTPVVLYFSHSYLKNLDPAWVFFGLGLILLAKSLLGLGRETLEGHLQKKLRHEWTINLSKKIMLAKYSDFDGKRAGHSLNIVSREILRAGNYVTAVLTLLSSGAYVIAITITAAISSWQLMSVASALLFLLYFLILRHLVAFSRDNGNKILLLVKDLMAQVNENLLNLREIKILNIENWRFQIIERRSYEVGKKEMRYAFIQALPTTLNEALFAFASFSLGILLSFGWSPDPKQILPLLAFLSVAGYKIVTSATSLASHRIKACNREASFIAVCELSEIKQERLNDGITVNRINTCIEVDDVSFSYPDGTEVFKGLHLRIELGKTTFLRGKSGSGKSTLLDLLVRLREVNRGKICANGHDIRSFNLKNWRRLYGYVGQDPHLFYGSVFDNIALDALTSCDEVKRAAKLAGIADYIESLPVLYETIVDERGKNFSGGQRRRIALARALVRNPQFILLDEATSAFESTLEREILIRLKSVFGLTIIVVSHRTDNLDLADKIIELDQKSLKNRHFEPAIKSI